MGNTTIYFNRENKDRLELIAEKTGVKKTNVLEIIISFMPVDYITDLVNNYKDDFKEKRKSIHAVSCSFFEDSTSEAQPCPSEPHSQTN